MQGESSFETLRLEEKQPISNADGYPAPECLSEGREKMHIRIRGLSLVGGILIILGITFLLLNVIPGFNLRQTWPLIFMIIAGAFAAPLILWPAAKTTLAVLLIPGAVFLSLGLIFSYASATNDWSAWAFAWTLIPAGAGLGLWSAARIGRWGEGAVLAGFWMFIGNLGLFVLIGLLISAPLIRSIAPIMLILVGILILLRSLLRPR